MLGDEEERCVGKILSYWTMREVTVGGTYDYH
jgi:hypothetical protein